MTALLARFVHDDSGQDLIEYALLGTFVSLLAYTGAQTLGDNLDAWYNAVATRVTEMTNGVTSPGGGGGGGTP